jgi:hypothetical protein
MRQRERSRTTLCSVPRQRASALCAVPVRAKQLAEPALPCTAAHPVGTAQVARAHP